MEAANENAGIRLFNPCLVVKVNERLFENHDTTFAKEDWVKANDILMAQDGIDAWLRTFLGTLSGSFRKSLASPVSPYHAITLVKPDGAPEQIDVDHWVKDNTELIDRLGRNQWLWSVLDLLESGAAIR